MSSWILTALALAQPPQPVVAMGTGVVSVAKVAARDAGPQAVGWIPALADCLEERKPGGFTVTDHEVSGETAASARGRVPGVRELSPKWVVVSLGAVELKKKERDGFLRDLEVLVDDLRKGPKKLPKPNIALLGLVPSGSPAHVEGVEAFNVALHEWAAKKGSTAWVDVWSTTGAEERRSLTDGAVLTDPGSARLAAAVCDVVLGPTNE